jgi:hypothetical protein
LDNAVAVSGPDPIISPSASSVRTLVDDPPVPQKVKNVLQDYADVINFLNLIIEKVADEIDDITPQIQNQIDDLDNVGTALDVAAVVAPASVKLYNYLDQERTPAEKRAAWEEFFVDVKVGLEKLAFSATAGTYLGLQTVGGIEAGLIFLWRRDRDCNHTRSNDWSGHRWRCRCCGRVRYFSERHGNGFS